MPPLLLDKLLDSFRIKGITIGLLEMQRLQQVLATAPSLTRGQQIALFQSVLAKNALERNSIRAEFNRLVPVDSPDMGSFELPPSDSRYQQRNRRFGLDSAPDASSHVGQFSPATRLFKLIPWLLLIVPLVLILSYRLSDPPDVVQKLEPMDFVADRIGHDGQTEGQNNDRDLVDFADLWFAGVVSEVPAHTRRDYWTACLSVLGGISLLCWIVYQTRRIRRKQRELLIPERHEETGIRGLPVIGTPDDKADFALLDPEMRRELHWSSARYATDLPGRKLDLPRTVRDSARQATPALRVQPRIRQRVIRIWLDEAADNPVMNELADEISQVLHQANIEFEIGFFKSVPASFQDRGSRQLWDVEQLLKLRGSLIVILLDHDSLSRSHRPMSAALSRAIRVFNQLDFVALVDCSEQWGRLETRLPGLRRSLLTPSQVVYWLIEQGQAGGIRPPVELLGKHEYESRVLLWAQACALPGRPISFGDALRVHKAMDLGVAWYLNSLSDFVPERQRNSATLDFSSQSLRLLSGFSDCCRQADQTVRRQCRRAIRFWLTENGEIEDRSQVNAAPDRPWKDSSNQTALEFQRLLLELWLWSIDCGEASDNEPGGRIRKRIERIASRLYTLTERARLKSDFRTELARYRFMQQPSSSTVVLPCHWSRLPVPVRLQLSKAGLGDDGRWIVRTGTGKSFNMLAGAAIAALLFGLYQGWVIWQVRHQDPEFVTSSISDTPPPVSSQLRKYSGNRIVVGERQTVALRDPYEAASPDGKGTRVYVNWSRQLASPARWKPEKDQDLEFWLRGRQAIPANATATAKAAGSDWPELSVCVVDGSIRSARLREFSALMVDTGNCDLLMLGSAWQEQVGRIDDRLGKDLDMQWLFFGSAPIEVERPANGHIGHIEDIDAFQARFRSDTPGLHNLEDMSAIRIQGRPRLVISKPQFDPITLADSIVMHPVPAGAFSMVSENGKPDERPVHTVTFSTPFYISRTEITFDQYRRYVEAAAEMSEKDLLALGLIGDDPKPELPSDSGWEQADQPVINVSWIDALNYTRWLSSATGFQCRLPSEAEWEYAARAGTTTEYFWGDEVGQNNANCRGCGSRWDGEQTAPVASFPPNAWGLYDMHGNVWEWVEDCWHESYAGAPTDGSAWTTGGDCERRVVRGGSWNSNPVNVRSAYRGWNLTGNQLSYLGFRVVCGLPFTDH